MGEEESEREVACTQSLSEVVVVDAPSEQRRIMILLGSRAGARAQKVRVKVAVAIVTGGLARHSRLFQAASTFLSRDISLPSLPVAACCPSYSSHSRPSMMNHQAGASMRPSEGTHVEHASVLFPVSHLLPRLQ